ncbi:MAG: serine hydrolase [Bacteroidales bacterium]
MKSIKLCRLLLTLLLLATSTIIVSGQDQTAVLKKGETLSALLKAGDTHRYTVNLNENVYATFVLEQKGVDAMITTLGPDGNKLRSFDSPNGRKGPEPVVLTSSAKGTYVLEVTALEEKGRQGNYTITWESVEPRGNTPAKQIDQLFSQWNRVGSPGAAIAVEKDGKVIFSKGYGNAELEYNMLVTPRTVFHIASVSKQFTCFSILLLEKDGKLSINDDVRKYIPEVPDFGKTITLNHLMHHTSGLRDQWELLAMAGWRLDDVITKDHILRMVSNQKELNFNPGDEFLYCNTGFTLLAEVVARVSGMSFADFTRQRIFDPLGMKNTLFYDDCEKIVKNRAYSYYADSTGFKKSNLNYSNAGATSLFTTTEDLCLWAANFEKPVVGDMNIVNRMNTRGILNKGDTITYAMGQDISMYKGLRMIAHGGADAGYRTFLVRFPDQKLSVNVLSNLGSFDPGGLALQVAEIYLGDKMKKDPPKKDAPAKKEEPAVNTNGPAIDLLVTYCGQYQLMPGNIATVTLEGGSLQVTAPGLSKTPMKAISDNEFEVKVVQARVTFLKGESGKVDRIKVILGGDEVVAQRLPDFDPAKVNLAEFSGTYWSPELNTFYTLVNEKGKLIARHFRTGDVLLSPSQPDQFSGDQWYFGSVEFTRDQAGKVKEMKVTGGRVRNMKFFRMD